MGDFTNNEKADIHLMYGADNSNGRTVLQLYQYRFPSRDMPNHKMFQTLHRQLCENGSFITSTGGKCRSRAVRQTHLEEIILDYGNEIPGTSKRAVACQSTNRLDSFTFELLMDAFLKLF
ncbi:uncharacterized protein TNCV_1664661 [Trichonephila clavipes]|uniref:DUF4817 domain-containing protein n=1 Tax=Trichonephila clavipes TaxID=2585209 RepID=A0A8X6V0Y5_TRICX|nr:uncharacterized protein TNCV_1664661 [Trichonephila clavipes]